MKPLAEPTKCTDSADERTGSKLAPAVYSPQSKGHLTYLERNVYEKILL